MICDDVVVPNERLLPPFATTNHELRTSCTCVAHSPQTTSHRDVFSPRLQLRQRAIDERCFGGGDDGRAAVRALGPAEFSLRSVGEWECGSVGVWECGSAGAPERRSAGVPACRTVGVYECMSVGVSEFKCGRRWRRPSLRGRRRLPPRRARGGVSETCTPSRRLRHAPSCVGAASRRRGRCGCFLFVLLSVRSRDGPRRPCLSRRSRPDTHRSPAAGRRPPTATRYRDEAQDRTVFTFCMCPGGVIVNASHGGGEVAVNGMSYSTRASRFANAAFVVEASRRALLHVVVRGWLPFKNDNSPPCGRVRSRAECNL